MTNQYDETYEEYEYQVLSLLKERPELSRSNLVRAVGLSTDSIHAVIATLLDKGLIKRDSCADPDEMRRHVHVLTDRGLAETARLARRSIARQMDEYAEFRAVIKAMRVDFAAAEDGESEA